ncbi:hypothetical protein [Curtobacterium sp. MCBD17_040]|uniref:DUF6998 domain-containing protein n=1 Tax=Curtobacterium sp. MCBD17_040 TaxID=2175674 RepID=UPI0011B79B4D|nr:hypothetical protein [Curtobacterium sp. MCBD17_040]WIB65815.1 hypothetical protein DEI94_17015 [Curtobacterium sp. MCBD17_040]
MRELLAGYAATLDELNARGIVRTRNPPLGDLAETLALRTYGGALEKNSAKSWDLVTDDGTTMQVKARLLDRADKSSQTFSAFRSFTFHVALFLLFDAANYDLVWARQLTAAEAETLGRRVEHTNSTAIPIRRVTTVGLDVTDRVAAAYDRIDEPRV